MVPRGKSTESAARFDQDRSGPTDVVDVTLEAAELFVRHRNLMS